MILQGDTYWQMKLNIPSDSVDCCVTSPPYYALRDYGMDGQIGLEATPEAYVDKLADVFDEVYRVLKPDGTLWLNIGDSYNGNKKGNTEIYKNKRLSENSNFEKKKKWSGAKEKDLIGIPWMLAFELRRRGWYLRQDIIWHKPNPMPESVRDRCTKSHEYIFLMSKSPKYYFDNEAIKEPAKPDTSIRRRDETKLNNTPGRTKMKGLKTNTYETRHKRDVWSVTSKPLKEAHFAAYPPDLIEPCILAGSRRGGVVLDPFFGSGTTGVVATQLGREYIGIELNPEYIEIAKRRLANVQVRMET